MSWIRAIAPLVLLGLIGCGSDEDRIKIVPVTGKVTKNGKPLAGATITFVPDASNKDSTPGVDATGPEGNYKMKWRNRRGWHPGNTGRGPCRRFTPTGPINPAFANDPYMEQVERRGRRGRTRAAAKKEGRGREE